jgi:hypothetical protein
LILVASAVFGYSLFEARDSAFHFVAALALFNYAIAVIYLIVTRTADSVNRNRTDSGLAWPLWMMVVIQYLAGFNYGGLQFAYQGVGTLIPLSYLVLRNHARLRSKWLATGSLVLILVASLQFKVGYVYHDAARSRLTETFTARRLAGIRSTPHNVTRTQELLGLIQSYTKKNDPIFVYPDYPALYYLADRENPTPVGWYYKLELTPEILADAMKALERSPADLILTHSDRLSADLTRIIQDEYGLVDSTDGFTVYLRGSP